MKLDYTTNIDIIISICSVFIMYIYLTNKYPDLLIRIDNIKSTDET